MMKTKTLILPLVCFSLSGCLATLQPEGSAGAADTRPVTAERKESSGDTAILDRSDVPVTEWNVSQLQSAQTVFVPAVFSSTDKGVLYIAGQPMLFNNLPQADVLGFIPSARKNTFFVAVASPRKLVQTSNRNTANPLVDSNTLKSLSPQEQLRMMEAAAALQKSQSSANNVANTQSANVNGFYVAIYEVDSQRKVLRELSGFETDTPAACVGRDGLFVATPVAGARGLVNYQGYNAQGQSISGPTNVLWASPAPESGNWYFHRPEPASRVNLLDETMHEWGKWSAAQGFNAESRMAIRKTSFIKFVNTSGVFVNAPPMADTARTGAATFVYSKGNSEVMYSQIIESFIHLYRFGVPTPARRQIDCFGLCNRDTTLISHKSFLAATSKNGSAIEAGKAAVFFADRGIFSGDGDDLQYLNQSQKDAFGALIFGGFSTKDKEPPVIYDVVNGAGINAVRRFMFADSGNSNVLSKSRNAFGVPYFVGSTNRPVVFMHARLDNPVVGFDTQTAKRLSASGYARMAGQYGVELN